MAAPRASVHDEALRWGRRVRVALMLLTAVFVLLAAGSIALVARLANSFERILETNLISTGQKIAVSLQSGDQLWFLPSLVDPDTQSIDEDAMERYSQLPAWESLRVALSGVEAGETPVRTAILSRDGTVLMAPAVIPSEEEAALRATDAALVARAAAGETVASGRSPGDEEKRVYIPLTTTGSAGSAPQVVGILRLEASRAYFDAVKGLMQRSLVIGVAAMVLLAATWYGFLRLMQRASAAERIAAQSERLRALGTLTAGIAHEIRNPLGIMKLGVDELKVATGSESREEMRSEVSRIAGDLSEEVTRLTHLTEQFLATARPETIGEPTTIDLGEETRQVLRLYRKGLDPERRKLIEEIPDDPFSIQFSSAQLRQILLNILRNADEALGNGSGTISVFVGRHGRNIVLEIADDGPGMSDDVAEQVFDPFFTTRAKGTGLGLSLCKNLVEGAGGRITLRTKPGAGATFSLQFPIP